MTRSAWARRPAPGSATRGGSTAWWAPPLQVPHTCSFIGNRKHLEYFLDRERGELPSQVRENYREEITIEKLHTEQSRNSHWDGDLFIFQLDIIIDNLNWIVMSFSAKFKRRKRYKFGECLHLLIYFILVWFPICQLPTFHLNKLSGRGTGFKDYVELKYDNSEYIYLFPVFSKCIHYVN